MARMAIGSALPVAAPLAHALSASRWASVRHDGWVQRRDERGERARSCSQVGSAGTVYQCCGVHLLLSPLEMAASIRVRACPRRGGGLLRRPRAQPVRAAPCARRELTVGCGWRPQWSTTTTVETSRSAATAGALTPHRGGQRHQRRPSRNRECRSECGSEDSGGVEGIPRDRQGAGRRWGGGGGWRGAARAEGWPAGGGAVVPVPVTAPHTNGAPPTRQPLWAGEGARGGEWAAVGAGAGGAGSAPTLLSGMRIPEGR